METVILTGTGTAISQDQNFARDIAYDQARDDARIQIGAASANISQTKQISERTFILTKGKNKGYYKTVAVAEYSFTNIVKMTNAQKETELGLQKAYKDNLLRIENAPEEQKEALRTFDSAGQGISINLTEAENLAFANAIDRAIQKQGGETADVSSTKITSNTNTQEVDATGEQVYKANVTLKVQLDNIRKYTAEEKKNVEKAKKERNKALQQEQNQKKQEDAQRKAELEREAKARIKAEKEKIRLKAKQFKDRARSLKAQFKSKGGIKGGIAMVVALLVGNMTAQITLRIKSEVTRILSKFQNQCPPPKELARIVKIKNNLLKVLNSFQKRLDKLTKISQRLLKTVTLVKRIIKIITSIPIPTSFPYVPGIPISILTKYSNALIKLNKLLDTLTDQAAAITAVIANISAIIGALKKVLEELDVQIEACSKDPNKAIVAANILETSAQAAGASAAAKPADFYYKGYRLEIVQDVVDYKLAPKRHAIAIDKRGVVMLYGPSSFSSSTQILLDELKFRIDQLL